MSTINTCNKIFVNSYMWKEPITDPARPQNPGQRLTTQHIENASNAFVLAH